MGPSPGCNCFWAREGIFFLVIGPNFVMTQIPNSGSTKFLPSRSDLFGVVWRRSRVGGYDTAGFCRANMLSSVTKDEKKHQRIEEILMAECSGIHIWKARKCCSAGPT
jgi:hypothetical protein